MFYVPTLDWVIENQPIMSGILTQSSSRKQFANRRKRSLKKGWSICIYLYYRSVYGIGKKYNKSGMKEYDILIYITHI